MPKKPPINLEDVGVPLSEAEVNPPPNMPMIQAGTRRWAPTGWPQTPYPTAETPSIIRQESQKPFHLFPEPGTVPPGVEAAMGPAMGLLHTATGTAKTVGGPKTQEAAQLIESLSQPRTPTEKLTYGAERIGEYAVPIAGEKWLFETPILMQKLKAPFLNLLARMAYRSGTTGAVAQAQSGEGAKAAGIQVLLDTLFSGTGAAARYMNWGENWKENAIQKMIQAMGVGNNREEYNLARKEIERVFKEAPSWFTKRWMKKYAQGQIEDAAWEGAQLRNQLLTQNPKAGFPLQTQGKVEGIIPRAQRELAAKIEAPVPGGQTMPVSKEASRKSAEEFEEYLGPLQITKQGVTGGTAVNAAQVAGTPDTVPFLFGEKLEKMLQDGIAKGGGYGVKASEFELNPVHATQKVIQRAFTTQKRELYPDIAETDNVIHHMLNILRAMGYNKALPQKEGMRVVMSGHVGSGPFGMLLRGGKAMVYGAGLEAMRGALNSAPTRAMQARLWLKAANLIERGQWDRLGDLAAKSMASYQNPSAKEAVDLLGQKASIPPKVDLNWEPGTGAYPTK